MNRRSHRLQTSTHLSAGHGSRRPPATAKSSSVSSAAAHLWVREFPTLRDIFPRGSTISPPGLQSACNGSRLRLAGKSTPSCEPIADCSETKTSANAAAVVPLPQQQAAIQGFVMPIKVDAGLVTPLQHAVNGACGGVVRFLRVQPVVRTNSVKVWLAMTRPAIELVMTAVMRTLPAAEFGCITPV